MAIVRKKRRVLITARAGDPLQEEGRARLIWASNSANACASLGFQSYLSYEEPQTNQKLACSRSRYGHVKRAPRSFQEFYNVWNAISVIGIKVPRCCRWLERSILCRGTWTSSIAMPLSLLPRVDIVHTRDWRIVKHAVQANIPTIYEDHSESFHRSIQRFEPRIVSHPCFRIAVGITEDVRERLIGRGIPAEKTTVFSSGLNEHSLRPVHHEEIQNLRAFLLHGSNRQKIVAYAGGLHNCRGVDFILQLASRHPDLQFVIMGGRGRQIKHLKNVCHIAGIHNVEFIGYRSHIEIPRYLQAADFLLMPYNDRDEAKITSPLKFFEYLAAGVPIVAPRIPAINAFERRKDLMIEWADICEYEAFAQAFSRLLSREAKDTGAIHRKLAAEHTWQRRQQGVLNAAGMLQFHPVRHATQSQSKLVGLAPAWTS
jgi:glycosyltransferase involved in cell wall biosynthesis